MTNQNQESKLLNIDIIEGVKAEFNSQKAMTLRLARETLRLKR